MCERDAVVPRSWASYLGVLIVLTVPKERLPGIGLCAVDLIWGSILTAFTQGRNRPFFLFFTFVVVASAYRWGFWETVATGVIVGLLYVVQGAVVTAGFSQSASTENGYDLNSLIIR